MAGFFIVASIWAIVIFGIYLYEKWQDKKDSDRMRESAKAMLEGFSHNINKEPQIPYPDWDLANDWVKGNAWENPYPDSIQINLPFNVKAYPSGHNQILYLTGNPIFKHPITAKINLN